MAKMGARVPRNLYATHQGFEDVTSSLNYVLEPQSRLPFKSAKTGAFLGHAVLSTPVD